MKQNELIKCVFIKLNW